MCPEHHLDMITALREKVKDTAEMSRKGREWRLLMHGLAICPALRTASLYIVQELSLLSGRSGMEALPKVPKRSART